MHWFKNYDKILRPGDGGLGYDTVLANKSSIQKARDIISRIARRHHLKLEWLTPEKLKKRLGNIGYSPPKNAPPWTRVLLHELMHDCVTCQSNNCNPNCMETYTQAITACLITGGWK